MRIASEVLEVCDLQEDTHARFGQVVRAAGLRETMEEAASPDAVWLVPLETELIAVEADVKSMDPGEDMVHDLANWECYRVGIFRSVGMMGTKLGRQALLTEYFDVANAGNTLGEATASSASDDDLSDDNDLDTDNSDDEPRRKRDADKVYQKYAYNCCLLPAV